MTNVSSFYHWVCLENVWNITYFSHICDKQTRLFCDVLFTTTLKHSRMTFEGVLCVNIRTLDPWKIYCSLILSSLTCSIVCFNLIVFYLLYIVLRCIKQRRQAVWFPMWWHLRSFCVCVSLPAGNSRTNCTRLTASRMKVEVFSHYWKWVLSSLKEGQFTTSFLSRSQV